MVLLRARSFCFLLRKVGNANFCLKAVVRSSVPLGLAHSNHLNVLQAIRVSVITVGRSTEALSAITRLNDVAEMQ